MAIIDELSKEEAVVFELCEEEHRSSVEKNIDEKCPLLPPFRDAKQYNMAVQSFGMNLSMPLYQDCDMEILLPPPRSIVLHY